MSAQAVPDSHNVFSEERIQTLSWDFPEESFLKFLIFRTEADSLVPKFSGGTIDIPATVVPGRERHRPSKPPVRETAISDGAYQKGHPRTGIRCAREEAGGKAAPPSQPSREKIPENPSPSFELGKDPIILLKTPERRLRTEFSLKRRGWPGRIGASSGWSFCDSRWCPRGDLNTRPKV